MDTVDLVAETITRVTMQGFDPHQASWDHKVCVFMHAAQGIIDNGGFEYFFESPFHRNPDMSDFPAVFEAVGAKFSADAVREALRRASTTIPQYDDLNKILWRESEANYDLLARYIKSHASSYT